MLPWSLAAVAELSYLAVWLLLLALAVGWEGTGRTVLPALLCLAATLLAGLAWESGLSERLLRREAHRAAARVVLTALAMGGGALVLGAAASYGSGFLLGGVLAGWYGFYLGARSGLQGISHHRLAQRFSLQWPLLVLVLLAALVAGAAHHPGVPAALTLAMTAYFGTTLAGLALARQRDSLAHQRAAGMEAGAALGPGGAALLTLLVLLLALVAAAAAGSALASDTWHAGERLLLRLADLALRLAWLVLYRTAALIVMLLNLILSRLNLRKLPGLQGFGVQLAPTPEDLAAITRSGRIAGFTLLWLGLAVLLLTAFLLRRRRRVRREGVGEVRESVFSWALLGADLRDLLAWLLGRLRRPARPATPSRRPVAAAPAALDLRAIYRRLQQVGAALGRPRRAAETPGQYQGHLAAVLPEGRRHAASITAAYERLRYGPVPPEPAEVASARASLDALEAAAAQISAQAERNPSVK